MAKGEPGILYIDQHEPDIIVNLMRQVIPKVAVVPLNASWAKADFYWVDPAGNERMYERKQLAEALGDLNGVEEQLHRHLSNCDELSLIIENPGMPTMNGVQTFKLSGDRTRFINAYEFKNQKGLWTRYEAIKWSLWHECGIYVAEVSHLAITVRHISNAYIQSYKDEHRTLNRYVVPHITPLDKDIHIENLMRLKNCGIGEVTARKLVEAFTTFHAVISASYTDLIVVMGGDWTRHFFSTIGRTI